MDHYYFVATDSYDENKEKMFFQIPIERRDAGAGKYNDHTDYYGTLDLDGNLEYEFINECNDKLDWDQITMLLKYQSARHTERFKEKSDEQKRSTLLGKVKNTGKKTYTEQQQEKLNEYIEAILQLKKEIAKEEELTMFEENNNSGVNNVIETDARKPSDKEKENPVNPEI